MSSLAAIGNWQPLEIKRDYMCDKVKNLFSIINLKVAKAELRKVIVLFWIQLVLLLLLFITAILVFVVENDGRQTMYLALIIGLMAVIAVSVKLNLSGKYELSAGVTAVIAVIGPWVSILADKTVIHSDFMPVLYIVLSVHICAILFSARITLAIAFIQIFAFVAYVINTPNRMDINWPSLFAFMVFSSTLAIVSSSLNRKLMHQIDESHHELQKDKLQLHELSVRDSLTGLFNRRYLEETLKREVYRAIRNNQSVGLIIADVDNFKVINDTHGHAYGDAVLCQVANVLSANTRVSDVACRYGGDEFILILPECSLADILKKADSLRLIIENTIFDCGPESHTNITLSFGVASFPASGASAENILLAADKALYKAKENGRNCVRPLIDQILVSASE